MRKRKKEIEGQGEMEEDRMTYRHIGQTELQRIYENQQLKSVIDVPPVSCHIMVRAGQEACDNLVNHTDQK